MERWQGKVAIVTGASSGIGLAIAKRLVQDGLIVIGLARRVDKMKDAMKDFKGPGVFHAKKCDVTSEENVIEVFNWIKNSFQSLNVLINNAGIASFTKIEDTPTVDLEKIFKVNVFGLLYCTKQAIKLMRENQAEAHIININSIKGHRIFPRYDRFDNVYTASKYAVTAISGTLRNELNDSKIRVTSISPGTVNTEMLEQSIASGNLRNSKDVLALQPEDVSNSIIHALSAPSHVEINEIILTPKRV